MHNLNYTYEQHLLDKKLQKRIKEEKLEDFFDKKIKKIQVKNKKGFKILRDNMKNVAKLKLDGFFSYEEFRKFNQLKDRFKGRRKNSHVYQTVPCRDIADFCWFILKKEKMKEKVKQYVVEE